LFLFQIFDCYPLRWKSLSVDVSTSLLARPGRGHRIGAPGKAGAIKTIDFPRYEPNELAAILRLMAKQQNYELPEDLEWNLAHQLELVIYLKTAHLFVRRKGFDGLAMLVQETLKRNPHNGRLFVFLGRRGSFGSTILADQEEDEATN
jgi:hypothetical protein